MLSALWLAERLAGEFPVAVLIESDKRRGARSVVRRATKSGHSLLVVAADEELPVKEGGAGCVVLENLTAIEEDEAAIAYLARTALALRPGGMLMALDSAKDLKTEERVSGLLLAAGYTGLAQERPRDGALLSAGHAPPRAALVARWAGEEVLPDALAGKAPAAQIPSAE